MYINIVICQLRTKILFLSTYCQVLEYVHTTHATPSLTWEGDAGAVKRKYRKQPRQQDTFSVWLYFEAAAVAVRGLAGES